MNALIYVTKPTTAVQVYDLFSPSANSGQYALGICSVAAQMCKSAKVYTDEYV